HHGGDQNEWGSADPGEHFRAAPCTTWQLVLSVTLLVCPRIHRRLLVWYSKDLLQREGAPAGVISRRSVATDRVHCSLPHLSIVADPTGTSDNQPGGDAAVTTWARLGRIHVRRASAIGSVLPVNVLPQPERARRGGGEPCRPGS